MVPISRVVTPCRILPAARAPSWKPKMRQWIPGRREAIMRHSRAWTAADMSVRRVAPQLLRWSRVPGPHKETYPSTQVISHPQTYTYNPSSNETYSLSPHYPLTLLPPCLHPVASAFLPRPLPALPPSLRLLACLPIPAHSLPVPPPALRACVSCPVSALPLFLPDCPAPLLLACPAPSRPP
jgi:hypothetical protein